MSDNLPASAPQSRGTMSIVPRTFEEAMRIASALAKSSMVPVCYRNKPEDVFAAMEMGSRLGMSAMQSLQNIAPINGKPSVYGDGFLGVIRAFPDFAGLDEDNAEKALAQGFGRCKMRRRSRDGSIEEVEQRVTVDAAKKAGWWGKAGPWTTTPGRMLQWRARAWAGRDLFADRLCGIGMAEEAMDCVVEATATVVDMMPRATVDAPAATEPATTFVPPPREKPRKVADDANRKRVDILGVTTATGEKNGKTWTRWDVRLKGDDGVEFVAGTFSDTLGPEMEGAVGMYGIAVLEPKAGFNPRLAAMEPCPA